MAEEVVVTNNQNEENAPSRLGSILIGILLVVAAFLAYNFFQDQPTTDNSGNEPSPTQIAENNGGEENMNETSGKEYTVQQGDTLWSIAQDQLGDGNRWKEIADANNLSNPIDLEVGATLTVPTDEIAMEEPTVTPEETPEVTPEATTEPEATVEPSETPEPTVVPTVTPSEGQGTPEEQTGTASDMTYTVKSGDTLWSIAQQFYGDGNQWHKIFDDAGNNLSYYTASNGVTYPIIHNGNVLTIPGVAQAT